MASWIKGEGQKSCLFLYIRPGAQVPGLVGIHDERLKIKIKSPPEDGRANRELIEFVSKILGVSKSQVEILRGESSRKKDLLVELPYEQVKKIIVELLRVE